METKVFTYSFNEGFRDEFERLIKKYTEKFSIDYDLIYLHEESGEAYTRYTLHVRVILNGEEDAIEKLLEVFPMKN